MQLLKVTQRGRLHVHYDDVRAKMWHQFTQLRASAHDPDSLKVMAELSGYEAGHPGILLQESNTKRLHTSPNEHAEVHGGLGCGWSADN